MIVSTTNTRPSDNSTLNERGDNWVHVVRRDGRIKRMSIFDLESLIGIRFDEVLRWQPVCLYGKWGVIDVRDKGRVSVPVWQAKDEAEARLMAATFNVRDVIETCEINHLDIYSVTSSLEDAKEAAREILGNEEEPVFDESDKSLFIDQNEQQAAADHGNPEPINTQAWIVNSDGSIEETTIFDIAQVIGPEVNTRRGYTLRWQPACVAGRWGVVDARDELPRFVLGYARNADEARALAAKWNIDSGKNQDLSMYGIHVVEYSLEAAQKAAENLLNEQKSATNEAKPSNPFKLR